MKISYNPKSSQAAITTETAANDDIIFDLYASKLWAKGVRIGADWADISSKPSSLKNPYALTISLNGTSQVSYDGSAAESINITPSSIGAATSGHNHDGRYVYNYGNTEMDANSLNKNVLGMSTNSGITGDWWHILQASWNNEYRWNSQIAFPTQNRNGMYYRSGLDDNTAWGDWVKLLDVGNSYVTGGKGYINGAEITQINNASQLQTARNLWGNSFDGTADISGTIKFNNVTSGLCEGIQWTCGDNDYARIKAGATGSNAGYLEIATADDGNEPIYVRQYTGEFSSVKRTLTLLDASGYTHFPGYINIGGNENNNSSPDRVWGSNGSDSYLRSYRTSALRVAYAVNANLATTASSANKLTTARNIALGKDLRGSANFDGSGNITINATINSCSVSVGSPDGLPFKRIAHFETGNSYNDNALLLYISQGYINGRNGICRVEFRTDNISKDSTSVTASAAVRWLVRNGYNLDSLYAGYYVTTGKAYIDIYLKTTGSYQGTVIRVLQDSRGSINSNVQLINSHYHSDSDHKEAYNSIEAASTALYNRAYTRIVSGSDVGTVNYANSTGSASSATKLQTARKLWGQSFDGSNNVDGTLTMLSTFTSSGIYPSNNYILLKVTNGSTEWEAARIGTYIAANNGNIGGYPAGLAFYTKPADGSNSSSTELRMVIDANGNVGIGTTSPTHRLDVRGDTKITGSIRDLAIGGGIYWNPYVESAGDSSDAASITVVRTGVAGGTTLVFSQMNDANDTIQFKTNDAARLYHNNNFILTSKDTKVTSGKGYIDNTEITQVNNADKVDNRHAISTTPNTGIIYKAAIYITSSLTSYWVRLASISSISQNGEFIATIHVQSGHYSSGRSAILLVYLRGGASSFMSKSFKICCNSNYDPNRFRLYYKDSDKTSEIWYQTTGQWDGIITTVISQSSEGSLDERLTLYSGSITAVQTPSMSTYLSAQVSTITDNISGNASTATNADKVDGYHASSLWRSDGATWNPDADVSLNASANNQEWSFDIRRNGHTGCYWHVWDSTLNTLLKVNADNGKVYAPYNFVGNLEGNVSTATKLQTARNLWGNSFDGTRDINGSIVFPNIGDTAISNKISWSGSTDGADIYYQTTATDQGNLVLNVKDDTNAYIQLALNGVFKSHFDVANSYWTGRSAQADKWTTARTFTIGNTAKNVDGSGNVSWSLAEIGVNDTWRTVQVNGASIGNNTLNLCGSTYIGLTNVNGKVTFSLVGSSTTANQAILTNGEANGWKLQTLDIANWDTAYNLRHSHANKSVLDGITSGLVTNWNTAYTFVSTITGTDTDDVINKWDEIVNFLAGIKEDNKLNTLLSSKLSVYELANNTNVGAIKNNGIYYSTTDASSGTLTNSPFNTGFALINMTSYDGGDDLRRSRLAFNAYGEIKVSDDRDQDNTVETWYNVLTSKNSGISGSTIKLNGTSITVYSSDAADGRYYTKAESDAKYITNITTTVNKLTFTKNGANINKDITVNKVLSKRNLTNIADEDNTTKADSGLFIYNSYNQPIGTNNYSSVLSINTGGTIQIAGNWGDDQTRNLYWRSQSDRDVARYPWKPWRTILDNINSYVTNGKGFINGSEITQVSNATNADKLDGYHASGLLTALSNSNRGISLTVGGTTKSLSNISVGDADTVDGEHAYNFSYTHQSSFDFSKSKSSRIVTFDQSSTDYGWINGFASTHSNYLTSVLFNTHRTSDWYVGYIEGNTSTGETEGLQKVHKLAFVDQIPTSLKNPHALTLKANGATLATYDGSSAKEANFTYANVGAASADHNHDNKYLRLDGSSTMTGQIKSSYSAGTWIAGCTNAILKATADGYNSLICAPIKSGNISISAWTNEENLNFGYAIKGKTENSFDTRMYWDAPNNNLHAAAFTGHLYGTADNATKLTTSRIIWGQSFDGTHDITGVMTINPPTITDGSDNTIMFQVYSSTGYKNGLAISSTDNVTRLYAKPFGSGMYNSLEIHTYNEIDVKAVTINANGSVYASNTITSAGFVHSSVTKNADQYVLTADGGYTFLNQTSNELAHEFSKDITVTSEWTDIEDFYGGNQNFLTQPGTYIVQVYYTTNSANSMYEGYFSGIMSWYTGTTNSNNADEIVLHRVGHAYANTIYLRTRESLRDDPHPYTKLQISANSDLKQHTYKFKFKRIC